VISSVLVMRESMNSKHKRRLAGPAVYISSIISPLSCVHGGIPAFSLSPAPSRL